MLLREYAIRWFVIPPLLTNVSALPGETWTQTPEIVSFQSCCVLCLENDTAFAYHIVNIYQPILIIFCTQQGRIIKYSVPILFLVKVVSFLRHSIQHDWKNTISRFHVSPGSAETLLRRDGITNHHLIAYSQIFHWPALFTLI